MRDLVAERTGRRPAGPIALLANLRTWGWLFNPISLYFCADNGDGRRPGPISSLVAEVQNTPWHERTAYVVGPPGGHRFAKELHVSPFLPMDLDYELRYTAPGQRLTVVSTCCGTTSACSAPPCSCVDRRSTVVPSAGWSGTIPP